MRHSAAVLCLRCNFAYVLLALVAAVALAVPQASMAQTITLSGPTTTLPFRDYATRELGDPWDMSQRTDLGWFTWAEESPSPNLTSLGIATDAKGNTYFTSRVVSGSSDPNFWLLDTFTPGAAPLGKHGSNYRIDTTIYNVLYIKMRLQNQVTRQTMNSIGQGVALLTPFWSRDTIYYDAGARPNGGALRPVVAAPGPLCDLSVNPAGCDAGLFLTTNAHEPHGSLEGGNWFIVRVPLTVADMKTNNSVIDHWRNVNAAGGSANWGDPGVTADSLRIDPWQIGQVSDLVGEMQIDWARLVQYQAGSATTVTWTGGGAYDVVVSTQPDCSDFAVLDYSQTSGFQFQSQILPPGTYRVGLRTPFTQYSASSATTTVACSSTTFTVQAYPDLALTSPNPEGSADDFATTFFGDAWDFNALSDIDFARNLTLPDANYGIVTKAANDPAGTDLGNVRLYRNRSNPGTPETGNVGDPHVYPLWSIPSQAGANAARGLNNRIDASRYRIFTADLGIERGRNINNGSILRVFWHVAGDTKPGGAPAEIETADIVLRHLDPAKNSNKVVLETVQFDMADRSLVPLETDLAQSASGWSNTCVASAVSTCSTSGATYKPGVDMFRVDFHEFAASTDSYIKRIKLAALERTGSTFNIQWTASNPSGLGATVTLKAVPSTLAAARAERPADAACGGSSITIASNIALGAGTYAWAPGSTAGITTGAEYHICAQISVPGVATPVRTVMSKFPIVVDPSYTGPKPTFQLDRTTLRFAGVHTGQPSPVFSQKTPNQSVRFTQSGAGAVNWTASVTDSNGSPINWISVSPTSGTGSGTLTIGLADDTTLPACSAVDGLVATVKLTSGDLGNDPQYVQVYVTIYPGATASPGAGCPHPIGVTSSPFGQIDTPVQNATGVQGAIGVTGWVLDDLGVTGVKIYRNCLPFDNPASCDTKFGYSVVFIGDAAFVAGARPDVEVAYPTHPLNFRGGWGYLMLTNMLPHVPNSQVYGGQGSLTLYAIATDAEGKTTMLGRSSADSTPTSITMANDSIAKPFGAIDTPGQGQTISGASFANFGWVLTRDANTTGGEAGDVLIPTNGSTAFVFIDGLPVATVAYNQCRGSVGNPVPAGLFCDDDVSNIFGNPSPLPTFTVRTSNPTRYRNLDATRGAIGAYVINTTLLSNGLHSIAWGVTDSAGVTEGIGSRNFIVSNGASDALPALMDAPARVLGEASAVTALATDDASIWGRTTFDLSRPWELVDAARDGVFRVRVPEVGRLELWLGERVSEGYLVANDTLRPLPPGSRLSHGHFTWAPVAGYIGDYTLTFLKDGARVPVVVSIRPASEAGAMAGYVDTPAAGSAVGGRFQVAGWAVDTAAWHGAGVNTVHVWAQRTDLSDQPPVFLGAAEVGIARPDVAGAMGRQFERAGWSLEAPAGLTPGTYEITAYFWATRTGRFEDARSVKVTVR